jgi:hypothetical protein
MMNLSKKLKKQNPNYIGTYRKSEVERMSEVFDMVRGMRSAMTEKGFESRSVVVPKFRGSVVDLYIEEEA